MAKTVLITGGSKGIGLAFVEHFAKNNWQVVTTLRSAPSLEFKAIQKQFPNIEVLELDVCDFAQYDVLTNRFNGSALDLLINNAGMMGLTGQKIGQVDPDNLQKVFLTNSTAPMMVTQTLYPALCRGQDKVIANITSRMGSITDNTSGAGYAYRASKAALNAMMKSCQIDVADDGIKILLLHPGWVKTDMGGDGADLTTADSVANMIKLINQAHQLPEMFYHCKGEPLPW